MTAVLVCGDIPSTGHVSPSDAERLWIGTGQSTLSPDDVLDVVRHRLDSAGYAVALYPTWRPEPALRALRLARSSLGTHRLMPTPCSLPPLALSLVADQLGYMAPYCPPGALASVASALERVTLAGAWVRTTTRLEHVPASLSDHVASYVPGSGFMVTSSPVPRVHRITASSGVADLPFQPADPVHVLTSGNDAGGTSWLREHLLPAIRAAHVRDIPAQPLGEAYWGTGKHLEFVAFSAHPRALQVIANSVRCRPCPWCGEPVATSVCPMCAMVASHSGSIPYSGSGQPAPRHEEEEQAPPVPGQAPASPAPPPAPPTIPQELARRAPPDGATQHEAASVARPQAAAPAAPGARPDQSQTGEPQEPPAQKPLAQQPPVQAPPGHDPPAQDPPAQDPPAQDPPAQDPPAQDPQAQDPPAQEPPRPPARPVRKAPYQPVRRPPPPPAIGTPTAPRGLPSVTGDAPDDDDGTTPSQTGNGAR